jgi:putative PIN family toxin of toxin-antitoxin system
VLLAVRHGRFTLVTSEPLLEELREALARPRIVTRYGITREDTDQVVALMRRQAEIIAVADTVQVCRDPDDDIVIETAVNGSADAIVTGDHDLLSDAKVREYLAAHGVRILTVSEFLVELAALATEMGA